MTVEVNRRSVLYAGAGVIGLAVVGAGVDHAEASTTSGLVRSTYAGSVGKVFVLAANGLTHRATLTRIDDLSPTTAKQRPYCFNLIFNPVGGGTLDDGIYTVSCKGAVTHDLSLLSLGTGGAMQAVVNCAP